MATATKSKTGFKVNCPHCNASESLAVKTHDLTLECSECSEAVSKDDIKQLVEDALRLIAWLDLVDSV